MHSLPHALLLGAQLWLGEASTNGCWAEGAEARIPRNLEVGCLLGRTSGTLLPLPPWRPQAAGRAVACSLAPSGDPRSSELSLDMAGVSWCFRPSFFLTDVDLTVKSFRSY